MNNCVIVVVCALLPFLAYVSFLMNYFAMAVLQAILELPARLKHG